MIELIIIQREELQNIIAEEISKALSNLQVVNTDSGKEIFNSKDAMKFLGVSRSTLQRWRKDRILPFRKIGSTVIYTKQDLIQFLDNNKKGFHLDTL